MASNQPNKRSAASATLFPSDKLESVRVIAPGEHPMLAPLPAKRLVVVDANMVIRAAIQRVKYNNPLATTTLEEIAATGTWMLVAPHFLRREVRINLREKYGDDAGPTLAAAEIVFRSLRFVRIPKSRRSRSGQFAKLAALDPKDLPYAWLYEYAAADFIWTKDLHFSKAGFAVLGDKELDVPFTLRAHCRAAADQRPRIVFSSIAIQAVGSGAKSLYRVIGPLGMIGLSVLGYLLYKAQSEETKQKLTDAFTDAAGRVLQPFGEFIGRGMELNAEARDLAAKLKEHTPARRSTLRLVDIAFRIAMEGRVSLDRLVAVVRAEYGVSPSLDYFKREIRRDNRLSLEKGWVSVEANVATAPLVVDAELEDFKVGTNG